MKALSIQQLREDIADYEKGLTCCIRIITSNGNSNDAEFKKSMLDTIAATETKIRELKSELKRRTKSG